jgi:hypothetical protein
MRTSATARNHKIVYESGAVSIGVGPGQLRQAPHIGRLTDRPAGLQQRTGPVCAEHRIRQAVELGFELCIRMGLCSEPMACSTNTCTRRPSCSMAVTSALASSIASSTVATTLRRSATMSGRFTTASENSSSPARPKVRPCRAAVVDAELGLQAVCRLLLAGELEHQRMHLELDARHLFG